MIGLLTAYSIGLLTYDLGGMVLLLRGGREDLLAPMLLSSPILPWYAFRAFLDFVKRRTTGQ